MAYRIDYGSGRGKMLPAKRFKRSVPAMAAGILGLLLLLAVLFWPAGRTTLRDLILPGDEEVTTAALQELVSELREGEPMGDVVTAFCQEIIAGGTQ